METRTVSKNPRAHNTLKGDDIVRAVHITKESTEVVIKKATITKLATVI
jgi:hypothetical protein